MSDYKSTYSNYLESIEAYLDEFTSQTTYGAAANQLESVRYSLLGGGKKIRPVLNLAVSEMIGIDSFDAMPVAGALEMIHCYSLIHDDLPDMDDDSIRRGKPSNHVVYGNATAILSGDALLTMAFESMLSVRDSDLDYASAAYYISKYAGLGGMVGGQAIDVEFAGGILSEEDIITMHMLKTGALLNAAVISPLYLKGIKGELYDILIGYSKYLGLAFQVRDDILDVEGNPAVLGKEINKDGELQKNTFVTVFGIDESKKRLEKYTAKAIQAAVELGDRGWFLCELARELKSRDK